MDFNSLQRVLVKFTYILFKIINWQLIIEIFIQLQEPKIKNQVFMIFRVYSDDEKMLTHISTEANNELNCTVHIDH
jgi:hypothetical protein